MVIGSDFINSNEQRITTNGRNGKDGQNYGMGGKGKPGAASNRIEKLADLPDNAKLTNTTKILPEMIEIALELAAKTLFTLLTRRMKSDAPLGTGGGPGGNGGVCGRAVRNSVVKIIATCKKPCFEILSNAGEP